MTRTTAMNSVAMTESKDVYEITESGRNADGMRMMRLRSLYVSAE